MGGWNAVILVIAYSNVQISAYITNIDKVLATYNNIPLGRPSTFDLQKAKSFLPLFSNITFDPTKANLKISKHSAELIREENAGFPNREFNIPKSENKIIYSYYNYDADQAALERQAESAVEDQLNQLNKNRREDENEKSQTNVQIEMSGPGNRKILGESREYDIEEDHKYEHPKKNEIHYHQHKHLHDHEHQQEHNHKHLSDHKADHHHEHKAQADHKHHHNESHQHAQKAEHYHKNYADHKHEHNQHHKHDHKNEHKHNHHHLNKHQELAKHMHQHKEEAKHKHEQKAKHDHHHKHEHKVYSKHKHDHWSNNTHWHDHHHNNKHWHEHKNKHYHNGGQEKIRVYYKKGYKFG